MLQLKVVNLWGGPGSGKSTLAAGLFNLMKRLGYSVELVTEFAKDLTYSRDFGTLSNQFLVTAQQDERLRRLVGQSEWAITDSPLPMGIAYMGMEYADWLPDATFAAYDRYANYDVWVRRGDRPYQTQGRNQTESEALTLDCTLRDLFVTSTADDVDFTYETALDLEAPYRVLRWLTAE